MAWLSQLAAVGVGSGRGNDWSDCYRHPAEAERRSHPISSLIDGKESSSKTADVSAIPDGYHPIVFNQIENCLRGLMGC
jgi:hypothetical protein